MAVEGWGILDGTTGSPEGSNLLSETECTFEGGLSGNWAGMAGSTVALGTSGGHTGSNFMRISGSSPQARLNDNIAVTPTTTYALRGWLRPSSPFSDSYLGLWYYDSGGTFIGSQKFSLPTGPTAAGVWTLLSGTIRPADASLSGTPASGRVIVIASDTVTTTATMDVDDLVFATAATGGAPLESWD